MGAGAGGAVGKPMGTRRAGTMRGQQMARTSGRAGGYPTGAGGQAEIRRARGKRTGKRKSRRARGAQTDRWEYDGGGARRRVAQGARFGYNGSMEDLFYAPLSRALADGVGRVLGEALPSTAIHIPARDAAASCAVAIARGLDADALCVRLSSVRAAAFPAVFGAPPVRGVRAQRGWLLFDLTDAFYSAAVRHVCAVLPPASHDCGQHAVNRLRAMARRGGTDCPPEPAVQRALLLALCATRSPAARAQAERALLSLAHGTPPRERPALLARCGGVADAAARILFALETERARA